MQPSGLRYFFLSLGALTGFQVGLPQLEMGLGAVGLKLARALEVRHGLLGPALLHVSSSRSLERIGQSWIALNRFAKHFERVAGISLLKIQYPPGFRLRAQGKTPISKIRLEAVVNHIDHVCPLAGSARHAAIGSDLDRGFGKEQSPSGLESIADLQKLANLLRQVGYAEPDVEGVMHANWIRFFRKAWGTPDNPS